MSLQVDDLAPYGIYTTSLALIEHLKDIDPALISTCKVAFSISLGEYAAFQFAGAYSFEDGLKLM